MGKANLTFLTQRLFPELCMAYLRKTLQCYAIKKIKYSKVQ